MGMSINKHGELYEINFETNKKEDRIRCNAMGIQWSIDAIVDYVFVSKGEKPIETGDVENSASTLGFFATQVFETKTIFYWFIISSCGPMFHG